MAAAMRTGDGLGDGAERAVDLILKPKAVVEDLDLQRAALVAAGQDRARPRPAIIRLQARGRRRRLCRAQRRLVGSRRGQAQVGIVHEFDSAAAGALGQIAFGQGLEPPGDAFDQPDLVVGLGRFAEDDGEPGAQLGDAQLLQASDLGGKARMHG
jgi:hypothetical protein